MQQDDSYNCDIKKFLKILIVEFSAKKQILYDKVNDYYSAFKYLFMSIKKKKIEQHLMDKKLNIPQ